MFKTTLFTLCLICLSTASALELESILQQDGSFFKQGDADLFLAANSPYAPYFRWVSENRREARYPGWANTPRDLTYADKKISEAIVRFHKDRSPREIYLSLYNRGDDGNLSPKAFQRLHEDLIEHFQRLTGDKGHRRRATIDSGMKAERYIWIHQDLAYTLLSSTTSQRGRKNAPEYLQLEIKVFDPDDDPREESMTKVDRQQVRSKRNLHENLVKQRNGTIFIDGIPMVDQGTKGYCVVATVERVLRYFNIDQVTQHTLAQIAKSSPQFGTSIDSMLEAVQKASGKLKVTLSDELNLIENIRDVEKLVKDYNRIASRKDRKKRVRTIYRGRALDLSQTFSHMDPELYLESRNQKRWKKKCVKVVEEHISEGLPILWSVFTGLAEGDHVGPVFGAHVRLIIGYNPRKETIIYSDSWGAGHEKKEMTLKDACGITLRMLVMKPRN